MKNLVIVGNSHAARECYTIFSDMLEHEPTLRSSIQFKGFLGHKGFAGNLQKLGQYDLGSDTEYCIKPGDCFAIGIGDTHLRLSVYNELESKSVEFFTLQSPFANICRDCVVGKGNIIGHACAFSCDIIIGNANYLNSGNVLGHDVRIGDGNFFGPQAMLLGGVHIGNGNRLGARSLVLEQCRIGNSNIIAPGAIVYKGCSDGKRLAGNPALCVD